MIAACPNIGVADHDHALAVHHVKAGGLFRSVHRRPRLAVPRPQLIADRLSAFADERGQLIGGGAAHGQRTGAHGVVVARLEDVALAGHDRQVIFLIVAQLIDAAVAREEQGNIAGLIQIGRAAENGGAAIQRGDVAVGRSCIPRRRQIIQVCRLHGILDRNIDGLVDFLIRLGRICVEHRGELAAFQQRQIVQMDIAFDIIACYVVRDIAAALCKQLGGRFILCRYLALVDQDLTMRQTFKSRSVIQCKLDLRRDICPFFERHPAAPRIAEQRNYRFGLHIRGIIRGFHRGIVRVFCLSFNIQPDIRDLRHLRADKVRSKGRVLFQRDIEAIARWIRSPAPAGKAEALIGRSTDVPHVAGNIACVDGTHTLAALGHFDRCLIRLAEVCRPRFVLHKSYRVRVLGDSVLRTGLLPILKQITVCRFCGQRVLIVANQQALDRPLCFSCGF